MKVLELFIFPPLQHKHGGTKNSITVIAAVSEAESCLPGTAAAPFAPKQESIRPDFPNPKEPDPLQASSTAMSQCLSPVLLDRAPAIQDG